MKLLIKLGGTLLDSGDSRNDLARQIAAVAKHHEVAVVHGGGKQLSRYLAGQGSESKFIGGLRVTPPEILDSVVRVLAGTVNHYLVASVQRAGGRAVGLSGIDAGLVKAVPLSKELGAVGRVESVDAALLDVLVGSGFIPVVACIAGGDNGAVFNVNADSMAVACAGGFRADQLIFLTDVEGVLDANQQRIPALTPQSAEQLIASGVARGGMEAKLRAAMAAVGQGISRVRIVAGAQPRILDRLLAGENPGTTMLPDNP